MCTLQSVIVNIGVVQYLLLMETICENTHTQEIVFVYGHYVCRELGQRL